MRPIIQETQTAHTPESLCARLQGQRGLVLLHSALLGGPQGRYSYVAAQPFLTLVSYGSRCELDGLGQTRFGNPFCVLEDLMGRYELADQPDLPFPLGGCLGYWGYDLKRFIEPRVSRRAFNDLQLPDCQVGFYDSLVAFDHELGKSWIISTGLRPDGTLNSNRARQQLEFWRRHLEAGAGWRPPGRRPGGWDGPPVQGAADRVAVASNVSRAQFIAKVNRAKAYIGAGDIYQVNLSQRLTLQTPVSGWDLFERLCQASPAPFAAFMDGGHFQLCSSSPELFLRLSGSQVQTRPIKGTRPRSPDWRRDAQLTHELETSSKEKAELIMITDLLRNDLGRVCEFGSVQVPELVRLERYAQVQHLVSTVAGRLRPRQTHLSALAACFPGGSVTGAPKIRAMEIIDELEPVARGPYTGALGYLGFNRQSQLSIVIRTAICHKGKTHFQVGAGIVADSIAEAEHEETLAKAAGFFAASRGLGQEIPCAQPA